MTSATSTMTPTSVSHAMPVSNGVAPPPPRADSTSPLTNGYSGPPHDTRPAPAPPVAPTAKKGKKKGMDSNEASKLVAARISQLELDAAGEKDQEAEIGASDQRLPSFCFSLLFPLPFFPWFCPPPFTPPNGFLFLSSFFWAGEGRGERWLWILLGNRFRYYPGSSLVPPPPSFARTAAVGGRMPGESDGQLIERPPLAPT